MTAYASLGCPPDVLAMVEAIHEMPSATVRNSDKSFLMARGIRQGCLLGPTLFIILLDYLLEQTSCREPLGVTFVSGESSLCNGDKMRFRIVKGICGELLSAVTD